MSTTTTASDTAAARSAPVHHRAVLPLTGAAAVLFTAVGLSGIGDAPHPDQPAAAFAAHFRDGDAARAAAPFAALGVVALAAFLGGVGRRLHRAGATPAAVAVVAGGAVVAGYLLVLQVVVATLTVDGAALSPESTKALFVATIAGVPALALGTTTVLVASTYGAATTRLMPAWWTVLTAVAAALSAMGIAATHRTGFLSADVQQQVVANTLLLWLVVTAGALTRRATPR